MTKKELLDFIMKTPYNSNWSIIKTLLAGGYSDAQLTALRIYIQTTSYNMNRMVLDTLLGDGDSPEPTETYKTTYFEDGTLIINEANSDRNDNITLHGDVVDEYPAWDGVENTYIWNSEPNVLWVEHTYDITSVIVGSEISPASILNWFENLESCTFMDLTLLDTSNVNSMERIFFMCESVEEIRGTENWNTSNVTRMDAMFYECYALETLNLRSWDTSSVTDMTAMFGNCQALETINVSDGFVVDNVEYDTEMFAGCISLVGGRGSAYSDLYIYDSSMAKIDGGENDPGYFTGILPYNTTLFEDGTLIINEPYTERAYNITEHGAVTNEYLAWDGNGNDYVFDVDDGIMTPWWDEASSVTSVIIGSPISPTSTQDWFNSFISCTSINLINLNTSNTTNMRQMFYYARTLTSIAGINNLNTSNVTNMVAMFEGCYALTTLVLTSFNTSSVTDMANMFYENTSLEKIIVGNNFDVSNVTESDGMFSGCTELVGGSGTTYDSNYIDKTRAKIDGGQSDPGYFSRPQAA